MENLLKLSVVTKSPMWHVWHSFATTAPNSASLSWVLQAIMVWVHDHKVFVPIKGSVSLSLKWLVSLRALILTWGKWPWIGPTSWRSGAWTVIKVPKSFSDRKIPSPYTCKLTGLVKIWSRAEVEANMVLSYCKVVFMPGNRIPFC